MRLLADWKWYAALAVFVLFTALIVWLPRPQAAPAVATAIPSPTGATEMPPGRPDPTPDETDAMLYYTVQDDDTVYSIARLFVIEEADLRWANHIPEGGEFTHGESIWIPVP